MASVGRNNGTDDHLVVQLYINGEERISSLPQHPVRSPSTTKTCWYFSPAGVANAKAAAQAARAACRPWSKTKPTERRDILLKVADLVQSHAGELCKCMELETGMPPDFAVFNITGCMGQLRDVAGRLFGALGGPSTTAMERTGRPWSSKSHTEWCLELHLGE